MSEQTPEVIESIVITNVETPEETPKKKFYQTRRFMVGAGAVATALVLATIVKVRSNSNEEDSQELTSYDETETTE